MPLKMSSRTTFEAVPGDMSLAQGWLAKCMATNVTFIGQEGHAESASAFVPAN